MVGVTISNGLDRSNESVLKDNHIDSCFDDRYSINFDRHGDTSIVTCSYPSYPIRSTADDEYKYIIEGMVYNRSEEEFFDEISNYIRGYQDGVVSTDEITEWVGGLDGEFVVYAINLETGATTIVRDYLSQLPLFYTEESGRVHIGRDKQALVNLNSDIEFDDTAVACYLALGYTPGPDTLFKGIYDIPQGSVVEIDGDLTITNAHDIHVGDKHYSDRSLSENARQLAKRFTQATKRRTERTPGTNIILLTGGLDSRGVLAAFEQENLEHKSATRYFEPYDGERDVNVAGELALTAGSEWSRFDIPKPTGSDLRDHLKMSSGTDPLHVGHIQVFFRELRDQYGDQLTFYTGDGGDKIFPDLRPARQFKSRDDLVEYIITSDVYLPLDIVESITDIGQKELKAYLREIIDEYPVTDPVDQYIYFQLVERAGTWLFEATDTNRNHAWTTTPYYALPMFKYAMNCPNSQKRRHRLFTAFLKELSSELTEIQNANFGAAPTEYQYLARVIGFEILQRYPRVYDKVIPVVRSILGMSNTGEIDRTFQECLESHVTYGELDGVVNKDVLAGDVLSRLDELSRNQRYHILTLLAVIDEAWSDTTVFSDYEERRFA